MLVLFVNLAKARTIRNHRSTLKYFIYLVDAVARREISEVIK